MFDPIGTVTLETSLQLLATRGCMFDYGELSGPVPAIYLHRLFAGSLFLTKYNASRWVEGFHEFAGLIAVGLAVAQKYPAAIGEVAGRFARDQAADAYRALESNPRAKILVLPVAPAAIIR